MKSMKFHHIMLVMMRSTFIGMIGMTGMANSFSPEPTDPLLVDKCESTGGEIIETYYTPDCGPGCHAMPETISDCECADGNTYMDIKRMHKFQGCDGSMPVCFTDNDCQRTNQGTDCADGVCMYAGLPDDNSKPCLTGIVILLILIISLGILVV
jgi:hypothetical protein